MDSVRNDIVAHFLRSDHTALLMIDDDVVPPEDVLRLTEVDADIAAIPYPMFRGENFPFPCVFLPGSTPDKLTYPEQPWMVRGRVEAAAVGTGCMLIHRHVLEHPDLHPPFMLRVNDDGVMTASEDVEFCLRARAAGFRIVADYTHGIAEHIPNGVGLLTVHQSYGKAHQRQREMVCAD